MKALVWVLNIIQFLVVYFFAFALFRYGIFELLPPETGLTARGVWPAASIGIALLPWKYYNRLSNYIIAQITNIKAPKTNISNMSKPKPSKLLYTFFFGYAALKWRRLIRTLIILPTIAVSIAGIYIPVKETQYSLRRIENGISGKNGGMSGTWDSTKYRNNYNDPNFSGAVKDLNSGIERYGSIAEYRFERVKNGFLNFLMIHLVIIPGYIFFGLLSWLIKPFVVKEG